jgi:hypothetical protein
MKRPFFYSLVEEHGVTQATFTLRPCRIRENRIVPQKDAQAVVYPWRELVQKFAPSGTFAACANLQRLRTDYYIGLLQKPGQKVLANFVFLDTEHSGKLRDVIRKDPTFADRVVEIYRVEQLFWSGGVQEQG